jgi:hypothetical protein
MSLARCLAVVVGGLAMVACGTGIDRIGVKPSPASPATGRHPATLSFLSMNSGRLRTSQRRIEVLSLSGPPPALRATSPSEWGRALRGFAVVVGGLAMIACGTGIDRIGVTASPASQALRATDAVWVAIYVDHDDRTMRVFVMAGCRFFNIDRIDVSESSVGVRVNVSASYPPRCFGGGNASTTDAYEKAGTVVLRDVLGARPIASDQPGGAGIVYRPPPCDPRDPVCEYVSPPPFPKSY